MRTTLWLVSMEAIHFMISHYERATDTGDKVLMTIIAISGFVMCIAQDIKEIKLK